MTNKILGLLFASIIISQLSFAQDGPRNLSVYAEITGNTLSIGGICSMFDGLVDIHVDELDLQTTIDCYGGYQTTLGEYTVGFDLPDSTLRSYANERLLVSVEQSDGSLSDTTYVEFP